MKQVAGQRVLSDDRPHPFGQAIKAATHIGRFGGQPDPRILRPVQRAQTRQTRQARVSNAATTARR